MAKWRETHQAEIMEYRRQYRTEHKDQIKAYQKEWIANNLDRCRAINEARRAREAGAAGEASIEQIQARWDYYGGRCYLCGSPAEAIDHVKPLSKGGANWPCNLRPICRSCNSTKRTAWPMNKIMERHYGPRR
jgi:5-methylcytosine-specific restriction endonuclease McrA